MNLKKIDWNHVTKYSQLVAIVLFVAVFALGFYLGKEYEYHSFLNAFSASLKASIPTANGSPVMSDATYQCDGGKTIRALYHKDDVQLLLSDGRNMTVPHAVSGSGARYANDDESFVFWNKGTTAFVTEGKDMSKTTYADCVSKPIPE